MDSETAKASEAGTAGAATLVVPLDGSPGAAAAMPVARTLAEAESATIHVLQVGDGDLAPAGLVDRLGLAAEELSGVVLSHLAGVPAEAIVRHATDLGSRLIVMASRAAQEPGRASLGEATREVLRHAPCPVVLVPPDRPPAPWPLRQILLPHGGSPTTASAIARVTELARHSGAELAVLHIASPNTQAAVTPGTPGALTTPRYLDQPQHEWPTWAREFVDRVTALGGPQQGVRLRLCLAFGEPADAIADFVAEHQADLVAIGSVSGWEAEQRPALRRIIDRVPVPLMIFPLEEAREGWVV